MKTEQQKLDRAVNKVTAFRSWDEMREVMIQSKYTPTLRAWTKEGRLIGLAAMADNLPVFWIGQ